MHPIQKVTLILYAVETLAVFFYSLWHRKKVSLGNFETTLFPAAVVFMLSKYLKDFIFSNNSYILALGLITFVFGSILGGLAFSHLGFINSDDFWFGRKENKRRYLVITGPYKYIRHPIFVSIALQYLGLVIVFAHPVSIILWFLALTFGIFTSLNEEKFMKRVFPEYKNYMNRTGRFFPKMSLD